MATLHKLLQTGCRYFRTINSPSVKYYQASYAYSTGSGSKKKRIVQENDPEAYDRAFEEARDQPEEFWLPRSQRSTRRILGKSRGRNSLAQEMEQGP